jgi:uncharacterized protein YndB with AHSA1/START domain
MMIDEDLTPLPNCVITTTRIFSAPVGLLFRAWTEPQHLKNWWGPNGFTNSFHQFNLVPGGKWSFTMHGPDGKDYPNESVFIQIEKPSLLVFNHISPPQFQVQTTFEEQPNNCCRVTFNMHFTDQNTFDKLQDFCKEKNEKNFDRLQLEIGNILY